MFGLRVVNLTQVVYDKMDTYLNIKKILIFHHRSLKMYGCEV